MGRIGRYEIIETLGTGAMGRVYLAQDTVLEREVALKTIQTGIDTSPEIRQRFQREARACARLRHPNIITVYDFGEADELAYIAMELLRGSDFRKLIQERAPVPVERKIEAGAQLCEALAYAHREGLIHRDIKPSNLFLTDEGIAKVLDFGIARLPASSLTMRGQVLGTPKYMAPEQIQGRPSDGRSDLFSVAVVLFEFLTGVHPFQSPSAPQRIVQGEPESLTALDGSLPPALERVIGRGLEKDIEARYATGDEFARELRAVAADAGRRSVAAVAAPATMPPVAVPVAPVMETPQPPAVAKVECPEGQDPEEWRLSEALRLLPEFEGAVERRDFATAKTMLTELEARLEGDIRFAEALRLCRSRMPLQAAPPPPPEVKAARAVETPAAPTKAESLPGGMDENATMFGRTTIRQEIPRPTPAVPPPATPAPIAAPPVVAPPPRAAPPPAPPAPVRETPRAAPPPPPPAPRPMPNPPAMGPQQPQPAPGPPGGGKRKLVLIGGVVICGAVLAVGAYLYLQPPPVETAVATATAGPGGANLYANPSPGESVVATVTAGGQVNVLSLPAQRPQEWIRVQVVTPSVSKPGYVRANVLRNWHARTAAAALAVARMAGAGDAGTVEELVARADQLSDVGSRYMGDPAGRQARLEAARLRVAAARSARDAGRPAADWTPYVKSAQTDLDSLSSDAQLRDAVSDLSQQAAAMLAAVRAAEDAATRHDTVTKKPADRRKAGSVR